MSSKCTLLYFNCPTAITSLNVNKLPTSSITTQVYQILFIMSSQMSSYTEFQLPKYTEFQLTKRSKPDKVPILGI